MNKQEIIDYLNNQLRELIKKYYANEVNYRTLTSMVLQKPNDKKALEHQTISIQTREYLKIEISQLRGVIKDIESDVLSMV